MATPEEKREQNIILRGNGSGEEIITITPNDVADLPMGVTRALYVGVEGAVSIIDRFGNASVVISGAAQYHPLRVLRVLATGTTATNILALY